jgi:hypothetical protein
VVTRISATMNCSGNLLKRYIGNQAIQSSYAGKHLKREGEHIKFVLATYKIIYNNITQYRILM